MIHRGCVWHNTPGWAGWDGLSSTISWHGVDPESVDPEVDHGHLSIRNWLCRAMLSRVSPKLRCSAGLANQSHHRPTLQRVAADTAPPSGAEFVRGACVRLHTG